MDHELVLYYDSIDEGASWLVDENLKRCGNPDECKRLYETGDPDFAESLKKDSINGQHNLLKFKSSRKKSLKWYETEMIVGMKHLQK